MGVGKPQDLASAYGGPLTIRLSLSPATRQMPQEVESGILHFHRPADPTYDLVSEPGCSAPGYEWREACPVQVALLKGPYCFQSRERWPVVAGKVDLAVPDEHFLHTEISRQEA